MKIHILNNRTSKNHVGNYKIFVSSDNENIISKIMGLVMTRREGIVVNAQKIRKSFYCIQRLSNNIEKSSKLKDGSLKRE